MRLVAVIVALVALPAWGQWWMGTDCGSVRKLPMEGTRLSALPSGIQGGTTELLFWNICGNDVSGTNLFDRSGNNHNGWTVSNLTAYTVTGGMVRTAVGTANAIRLGDHNRFTMTNDATHDGGFTFGCWVNFLQLKTAYQGIVGKHGTNGNNAIEYVMFMYNSNIYARTVDDSANAYLGVMTASKLTPNKWWNIVWRYSGGAGVSGHRIYTNGVLALTNGTTAGSYIAMENSTNELRLGNYYAQVGCAAYWGEAWMTRAAIATNLIPQMFAIRKRLYGYTDTTR